MKCIRHNLLWFLSGFLLILSAGSATAATYVVGTVTASGDRYMIKGETGNLPLDIETKVVCRLGLAETAPATLTMAVSVRNVSNAETIFSTHVVAQNKSKYPEPMSMNIRSMLLICPLPVLT